VNEYYHEFKICVLFGSLDECNKDVMSRFMKGLNSKIQTMLIHETYNHIGHLFLLARIAEKQILLSITTLVTCFYLLELTKNRFYYLEILA
jgi:hypothetical protein